jgi:hypothetical protein
MMSHPLLMTFAVLAMLSAALLGMAGGPWRPMAIASATLVAGLALERFAAGISAARRFRTFTPLLFPVLHLGRDLAWVAAIGMWLARRVVRRPASPAHSMRARSGVTPDTAPQPGFAEDLPAPATPPRQGASSA